MYQALPLGQPALGEGAQVEQVEVAVADRAGGKAPTVPSIGPHEGEESRRLSEGERGATLQGKGAQGFPLPILRIADQQRALRRRIEEADETDGGIEEEVVVTLLLPVEER